MSINNVQDFIRISAAGISIASPSEIRENLIARYKSVYGSDIDLSTGSADGIYINNLAMLINNILQTVSFTYSNLDIKSADGQYLEALCALTNVYRKPAYPSSAYINVTSNDAVNLRDAKFIDKAGNLWIAEGLNELLPNTTREILVKCTENGPIEAPAGWINACVDVGYVVVEQTQPASIGSFEESDQSLRERRIWSADKDSYARLRSSILNIPSIQDVLLLHEGITEQSTTYKDGTTKVANTIYVVIRTLNNVHISSNIIGEAIHNALTPGIGTNPLNGMQKGTAKQYDYQYYLQGIILDSIEETVYWKEALPVRPAITAVLTPTDNFTESLLLQYVDNVLNELNNKQLGYDISDIKNELTNIDTQNIVSVTSAEINGSSSYTNLLTYYDYRTKDVLVESGSIYGSDSTITISNHKFTFNTKTYTFIDLTTISDGTNLYTISQNKVTIDGTSLTISPTTYQMYLL